MNIKIKLDLLTILFTLLLVLSCSLTGTYQSIAFWIFIFVAISTLILSTLEYIKSKKIEKESEKDLVD